MLGIFPLWSTNQYQTRSNFTDTMYVRLSQSDTVWHGVMTFVTDVAFVLFFSSLGKTFLPSRLDYVSGNANAMNRTRVYAFCAKASNNPTLLVVNLNEDITITIDASSLAGTASVLRLEPGNTDPATSPRDRV